MFVVTLAPWDNAGSPLVVPLAFERARLGGASPGKHALNMAGNVVNLNRFRKKKVRDQKAKQAATNRIRHGLTSAEKERERNERARAERAIDGKRLEGGEPTTARAAAPYPQPDLPTGGDPEAKMPTKKSVGSAYGTPRPMVGVFIGGASSRMGGRPKGLLKLPDGETIVARTLRMIRQTGMEAVLVGDLDVYDALAGTARIRDATSVSGPLAGLLALLTHAHPRAVIAVGCDMPFLTAELLQRLASEAPDAVVLAPRSVAAAGKWEPLCARYAPDVLALLTCAIDSGDDSFQQLFKRVQVTELPLTHEAREATVDWDSPADLPP